MKKKKLKLTNLKVQSFVTTTLSTTKTLMQKGGTNTDYGCESIDFGCPTDGCPETVGGICTAATKTICGEAGTCGVAVCINSYRPQDCPSENQYCGPTGPRFNCNSTGAGICYGC